MMIGDVIVILNPRAMGRNGGLKVSYLGQEGIIDLLEAEISLAISFPKHRRCLGSLALNHRLRHFDMK